MFPFDYSDFLPPHLNPDSAYDYDFDAHIAQCANVFGPDEFKGFPDGHHNPPFPMVLSVSDGFGSSDSSGPSRSPSIIKDTIKAESSDGEGIVPRPPSPPQPLIKGHERMRSREDLHVHKQPSPVPSTFPKVYRSKMPLIERSSLNSKISVPEPSFGRRTLRKPVTSAAVQLSDEDADDESDTDTDDEYVPTSRSAPSKRRRISSQLLPLHPVPPKRNSSISPIPVRRLSGTSLSRNRQASSVTAIVRACDGTNLNFICPECGWKQANKRLPDFKRHLRTHTRPDETDQTKGWWCKGVPVQEAHKFNISKDARSYIFLGQERIGGCMQTFSRRDALKRHLDNANVVCVGRPSEASD